MQTILGSGGAIGIPLANELTHFTDKIKLAGRNPRKVNPGDELIKTDLTDRDQTMNAVKGSDIVYLVAGLKYDLKIWREQWPVIMKNVINACLLYHAKLVFFDNVYMYGKVSGRMTENTPFNPCSEKGKLRAHIAQMLIDEYKKKNLNAVIVRAADFYGPNAKTGILNFLVIDQLRKRKTAHWFLNDKVKHSFTFTPDAAKAVALIGNTPDAFNQTWHLPTHRDALTGEEFIKLTADILSIPAKWTLYKKWQLDLLGLFNSDVKALNEMLYQYEDDYLFDSSKYENYFKIKPTNYVDGIKLSI